MNNNINYKASIEEIEDIIRKIESGEPDIDELSSMVKRAALLISECKKKLKATEDDLEQTLNDQE